MFIEDGTLVKAVYYDDTVYTGSIYKTFNRYALYRISVQKTSRGTGCHKSIFQLYSNFVPLVYLHTFTYLYFPCMRRNGHQACDHT